MNYRKTTTLAMLTAVIAGAAPSISSAQVLEEIVVTATKRAVGLQDVPIAISVMS